MVKYILRDDFSAGNSTEISKSDFERYGNARDALVQLWELEEVFAVFARAYVDFEEQLYRDGLDELLKRRSSRGGYLDFGGVRVAANQRLISVLTSARMYVEYVQSGKNSLARRTSLEGSEFSSLFSNAFDSSLEYRVMDGLRNHAQHHKLPIKGLTFSHANLGRNERFEPGMPSRLRFTVDPAINCREFVESKKVRSETRQEVKSLNCKWLDVKFFLRGYVGQLGRIHYSIREKTDELARSSLGTLKRATGQVERPDSIRPVLVSMGTQEDGSFESAGIMDYSHFSNGLANRRDWLGLENVQRLYLSSEIVRNRDVFPQNDGNLWIPK